MKSMKFKNCLINTQLVSAAIKIGDFSGIKEAMKKSMAPGAQMFEEDLAKKVQAGIIHRTVAMDFCDSAADLASRLDNVQAVRKHTATDTSTDQLLGSISLDLVQPVAPFWPELSASK